VAAFTASVTQATPPAADEAVDAAPAAEASQQSEALRELARELDELAAELQAIMPDQVRQAPYSPLRLLGLIRDNASKMRPEIVQTIRESFAGMTAEDLRDLDTWKGLAYMMSYSARFQAEQMGGRLQSHLPQPLQPTRLLEVAKKGLDKIMPDFARQLLGTFEGATKEDLLDPDTWKGVWYMINYSLQFQAEQLKERLLLAEEADR
jgi:hypothetical protein